MPLETIAQHAASLLDRKDVPDDAKQEIAAILNVAKINILSDDQKWGWIDRTNEPMFVYDNSTRFVHANPAATMQYGYSRDEFLGMTVFDIRPLEDHERMRQNITAPSKPEITGPNIWRHVRKNGDVFDVEVISTNYPQAGKGARLVLARDATRLKKEEARLREVDMASTAGMLAAYILHDTRNHLMPIGLFAKPLAQQLAKDNHKGASMAQQIVDAYETTAAVLAGFINLQHEEREMQLMNVNRVIMQNKKLMECVFRKKYSLTIDCQATGLVNVDPSSFGRVISNLAMNARDAMPQGGELTISTRDYEIDYLRTTLGTIVPHGEYVLLSVRDTGCGIPAQAIPRIFEQHYTTKPHGTGLGLPSVLTVVNRHKGYLDVESKVGEGTCFSVYLPRFSSS